MRLSDREFKAMNRPFRKLLQRRVELPFFKKMGLSISGKHVLEIGCGSGYGAELLMGLHPESYLGVDLMPEQIALAQRRGLNQCAFFIMDAEDLSAFNTGNYDVIIIFGILHHIPAWRNVINETSRLLKKGGRFFIVEPDLKFLKYWEAVFKWGHPAENDFSLKVFEKYCQELGFIIEKKKVLLFFGFYRLLKQGRQA
ncbi:MAG: class I SAM-dependent methyltransferase [Spirochaetales bacterium]|nr:class I SAM-dependent methyltransferase [Spirochaetales bacterium]